VAHRSRPSTGGRRASRPWSTPSPGAPSTISASISASAPKAGAACPPELPPPRSRRQRGHPGEIGMPEQYRGVEQDAAAEPHRVGRAELPPPAPLQSRERNVGGGDGQRPPLRLAQPPGGAAVEHQHARRREKGEQPEQD